MFAKTHQTANVQHNIYPSSLFTHQIQRLSVFELPIKLKTFELPIKFNIYPSNSSSIFTHQIQRLSVFLTIRSQTESKVWSEIKSTNSWHRNVRKNTSNSKCSTQYLPIIITQATKSWWRQEVGKSSFNVSNCCCRAQSSAASTTRSQEGLVSHVLREYNFLIDKNLFGPQWFLMGPWLKPSGPQKECWSVFNPQIHKQHQWHYRTRGAPKPIYIGIGVSSIGGGAG